MSKPIPSPSCPKCGRTLFRIKVILNFPSVTLSEVICQNCKTILGNLNIVLTGNLERVKKDLEIIGRTHGLIPKTPGEITIQGEPIELGKADFARLKHTLYDRLGYTGFDEEIEDSDLF